MPPTHGTQRSNMELQPFKFFSCFFCVRIIHVLSFTNSQNLGSPLTSSHVSSVLGLSMFLALQTLKILALSDSSKLKCLSPLTCYNCSAF